MKREHFPALKRIAAELHQMAIDDAQHVISIRVGAMCRPEMAPNITVLLRDVAPPEGARGTLVKDSIHWTWVDEGIAFTVIEDVEFLVIGRTLDHTREAE